MNLRMSGPTDLLLFAHLLRQPDHELDRIYLSPVGGERPAFVDIFICQIFKRMA